MIDAAEMSSARVKGSSSSDDWNTPPDVLALVQQIGRIDYDPCSNETSLLACGYRSTGKHVGGEDGLDGNWSDRVRFGGLVFVNPPYSKLLLWADKCVMEAERGTPIVMLIPARTDTRAWHRLSPAADAIALWKGRMRFWVDGAPADAPAPFPSALPAFGVSQRRMKRVFSAYAEVMVP